MKYDSYENKNHKPTTSERTLANLKIRLSANLWNPSVKIVCPRIKEINPADKEAIPLYAMIESEYRI